MGWQVERVFRSVKLKKALVFSKEILNGKFKNSKGSHRRIS